MIKDVTKRVFSLRFSVFSAGGVRSVEDVDFELIGVPRGGRLIKFQVTNLDFRMGLGTTKVLPDGVFPDGHRHANGEPWRGELIRIPGFGRYRKATEGIGRLGKFSGCRIRPSIQESEGGME
jgi:hypothetical protein